MVLHCEDADSPDGELRGKDVPGGGDGRGVLEAGLVQPGDGGGRGLALPRHRVPVAVDHLQSESQYRLAIISQP